MTAAQASLRLLDASLCAPYTESNSTTGSPETGLRGGLGPSTR